MKVLVTGAGGFVGRHMVKFLTTEGVRVQTLGLKKTSEDHFFADLGEQSSVMVALKEASPDYVIHLAGCAYSDHLESQYSVNTLFAVNLVEAMRSAGLKDRPILFAGTAAEYGEVPNEKTPIEESTPAVPLSHYGISKLAQSLMGITLARDAGWPIVVARTFNIIGPGMTDKISVRAFADQIARICEEGDAGTIDVGNLSAIRDFIDVSDVVKILWKLVRTPDAYGEIVNVCSGKPLLMQELLERLIAVSKVDVTVDVNNAKFKNIDIPISVGSTEKLHRLIGDVSLVDIDQSLKRILDDALASTRSN